MKYKWLFILSMVMLPFVAHANASMEKANRLYTEGNYTEALQEYKILLDAGYHSASVYYNTGNAYFKLNRLPEALLYFEKAALLAPGDDEVNYNLKMVQSLTGDKTEEVPMFFLKRWVMAWVHFMSLDAWAWASVILFLLTAGFLLLFLFANTLSLKRIALYLTVVMLVFSVSAVVSAQARYRLMYLNKGVVVMSSNVTAKSSPSESGRDLFVIHEGTRADAMDQVGEWCEIRLLDGNKGWIKTDDIAWIRLTKRRTE